MLVSHESPLALLERSREYNDYDYALVHILDELPQYYDFFKIGKKLKRRILLDNSIFELGVAFNADKFAEKIIEMGPSEYIIPDALDDFEKTINQFDNWINTYNDLPGKKIGVIQGKTYKELSDCYTHMSEKADKIAISFGYKFYKDYINHPNNTTNQMLGRITLISNLLHDGIIRKDKPHHLLGCGNPLEFSFYNKNHHHFIDTIDTSSPIVHAILNIKYPENMYNWKKESNKLIDMIHVKSNINSEILQFNLNKFRSFIKF